MTAAPSGRRDRPISPFLDVWRWHLTMLTSILHRATGVGLYVGAIILAGWAIALASGEDAYDRYMAVLGSFPGKIVMFGLTAAGLYHLANGIRHLVWDAGHGLDVKSANTSGVFVIAFTAVGTIAVWVVAAMTGAL